MSAPQLPKEHLIEAAINSIWLTEGTQMVRLEPPRSSASTVCWKRKLRR